ncbi:hypothetical protein [Ekhidna sp.]
MQKSNCLILFFILTFSACEPLEQEKELINQEIEVELPIRTYYYIPGDAAKRFGLKRKVQIIRIEEAITHEAAKFYLNKPTQLRITTEQLTDYPISIKEIKNAKVDTSNIENFLVTVTPTDSAFQFAVYRDFSERNAIFSRITYDKEHDSLVHSAFLMKKEMIEGIIKFNVEQESNSRYH